MSKSGILIIDYGIGNIQSVSNALEVLDCSASVSSRKEDLAKASAFILPGVGAFGEGIANLRELGLIDPLSKEVFENKKPILGICLGMQLFAETSEEKGLHQGLGWIEGKIKRFTVRENLRVPHVGWNNLDILKTDPMFSRISQELHVYFDHSYHYVCDECFVSATCDYGERVVAAVQKDNIFGVQFHPEKSQNNGLRILRGFANYVAEVGGSDA